MSVVSINGGEPLEDDLTEDQRTAISVLTAAIADVKSGMFDTVFVVASDDHTLHSRWCDGMTVVEKIGHVEALKYQLLRELERNGE